MPYNEEDVFGQSVDFCEECGCCGHREEKCPATEESGIIFLGEVITRKIEPLYIGFDD